MPHMQIDIVSDTICPWCYIGKRRFERALANRPEISTEIDWRAYQLNPDMPLDGMDRNEYLVSKFGSPEQASEIYQRVTEAGESEGINFAFDRMVRTPNTVNSHRLIRWSAAHGRQNELVSALFVAYFENAVDIGDINVLAEIAEEAQLSKSEAIAFLASNEQKDEILAECQAANQMGVNGVPCFIFDKKYAVSGAHEPAVFERAFDLSLQGEKSAEDVPLDAGSGEQPSD